MTGLGWFPPNREILSPSQATLPSNLVSMRLALDHSYNIYSPVAAIFLRSPLSSSHFLHLSAQDFTPPESEIEYW